MGEGYPEGIKPEDLAAALPPRLAGDPIARAMADRAVASALSAHFVGTRGSTFSNTIIDLINGVSLAEALGGLNRDVLGHFVDFAESYTRLFLDDDTPYTHAHGGGRAYGTALLVATSRRALARAAARAPPATRHDIAAHSSSASFSEDIFLA